MLMASPFLRDGGFRGSWRFAPRSGYGGAGNDPGGEGAGFWFRGPNNYIRNNVAANGDVFGFGLAAGALGNIRIPLRKGADMTKQSETRPIDTTDAQVLEFANNEAYDVKAAELALHKDWQDAFGAKPAEFLKLARGSTIGSATEIRSDKRGEIRATKRLNENR